LRQTGDRIKMRSAVKPHHLNEMKVMKQAEKASMARPVGLLTISSSLSLRPSEEKRKGNMVDASFNMRARGVECKDVLFGQFVIQFHKKSILCHAFTYAANTPSRIISLPDTTPQLLEDNSFIHSLARNKMAPEKAKDLVYVHTNLHLLSRSTSQYNEGERNMWDLGVMGLKHVKAPIF